MNVLVSGQGSGSGSGGTICVRGTVTDEDGKVGVGVATVVRVTVVPDHVNPPPPFPDAGGIDVVPVGTQWCARDVPVPWWSPAGSPCTAVAWVKTGSSGWSDPYSVWFNAGGPDPIDCCVGCVSGGVVSAADPASFSSWPPPPPPLPSNLGG
ncbi:MAG: hypothetical protein J0I06_27535 [Planctomycetes bacterium]|nr:hypothetical protein [Planctomycetota bacterium]